LRKFPHNYYIRTAFQYEDIKNNPDQSHCQRASLLDWNAFVFVSGVFL